jgi:hypothetical protein
MGGNWGTNREATNTLPAEYFEYLRDMNVNWVGISVALHYEDSMDSTVERVYSGVITPTFTDEFLKEMIQTFRRYGICVYLTLAFESNEAEEAEHRLYRKQLGVPIRDDGRIQPEFWPWALDHSDHERFVAEFWQTYTEQAVHFGQLAEEEGVGLYSLGTETEGLFRTRPSEEWPNDFREELRAMVAAVRAVFSGPLTYDMWNIVYTLPELGLRPGSEHLWEDAGLDVIGFSAYFPLAGCPSTTAIPVENLEARWERIFQDYLIPLHAANPGRPIFFTEYGYSDSLASVVHGAANSFTERNPVDRDGSGFDDGEEMQASIHQALFNVMDRHPGVLDGVFTWDMWMADHERWASEIEPWRSISIRGRLAEDVFRQYYGASPRATLLDPIPPSSLILPQPLGETCDIYNDGFSIEGEGWHTQTWNSDVNIDSSKVVHSGERAIELILQPGGSMSLKLSSVIDISPFNWLVFFVAIGEIDDQQIGITLEYNNRDLSPLLDVTDYIEGGQLEPYEWHQVAIPVSEINPGDGSIDTIKFVKLRGSGELTVFIDDVFFVEKELPVSVDTIYIPTPTPTLSPDQEISHFIYDDATEPGWDIYVNSGEGEIDPSSRSVVHNGQFAIEAKLDTWASFAMWTQPFDTSQLLYLEFYINGGPEGGQQINVLTIYEDGVLTNLATSDYTGFATLPPGEWVMVRIPVEDLNPSNEPVNAFVIENHTDDPAPTFYVDDIRFVGAGP